MRFLRYLSFLVSISLTCMTAGAASKATLVELPTEKPVLSLSVPGGWTVTSNGRGGVECTPSENPGVSFAVLATNATTEAQLTAFLPKMTKQVADTVGLENVQNGDLETTTNVNGVPFTCMKASAKAGFGVVLMSLQAFEPQEGKFYLLMTFGAKDECDKHEKDFQAIYNSVKLLKP